jgi:hypothetical protein
MYVSSSDNPFTAVLRLGDRLQLSEHQRDTLRVEGLLLNKRLDSLWAPTATLLGTMHPFKSDKALAEARKTRALADVEVTSARGTLRTILTPDQLSRVPSPILLGSPRNDDVETMDVDIEMDDADID